MKIRVTVLAASVAALVLAAPVLAKGPSEAKISGPGLKGGGIHLKSDRGGDPSSGTPLGDLTEFSGFFPAMFGQEPDPMLKKQPKSTLGPKYTIEYKVPGPNIHTATIRQDLYPYAEPNPLTYTKPGQPFFQAEHTKGGWFVGSPDLKATLVGAGLPKSAPSGGSSDSWALSWGATTIVAAALLLLALTFLAYRRRPRTVGA
jgi:hypothetical protein